MRISIKWLKEYVDFDYSPEELAEKLGLKGYKLQINVGKDGGQEVFHLHLHLLSAFA